MIKQRFTFTFILALTLSMLNSSITTTSAQAKPDSTSQANYPEFSWDHIPRYMHIRKDHAYTKKEIEFIAKFPLITFEKSNGHRTHKSTEAGTLVAAKAVKKINPLAKILYYRNVIVHYDSYAANKTLPTIPDALLSDKENNTKLIRDRVAAYDLSNPSLRKWWLDQCKEMTASPLIDGIFLDGNIKALEPNYLTREIGNKKKQQTITGYHTMMKDLRTTVGPDKLLLSNIIRARFDNGGLEYLDYFDGSYLEGFFHKVGKTSYEEYTAKGIAAMQQAARQGKIIAFTSGLKHIQNTTALSIDEVHPTIETVEDARKGLQYPLGIFLICAEKYSYFRAHEGYEVDKKGHWMRWFPEYDRPLGKPLGPATKEGYIYTRKFEHASVTVDLTKRSADIQWK